MTLVIRTTMRVTLTFLLLTGHAVFACVIVQEANVRISARPARYDYGNIGPNNRTLCPETEPVPPEREYTAKRVRALRDVMNNVSVDAYLVPYGDEHGGGGVAYDKRLQYISGFSGSNGFGFVTKNKAALWTDGRYFTQGDREMDCDWILMESGMAGYPTATEWLVHELESGNKVGADARLVNIDTWESYESELEAAGIEMMPVDEDLVDLIWTSGRPDKPNNHIYEHTIDFAGVSWEDKIVDVRKEISNLGADVLMITALDETAWLFNLRGSDYPTSPMFYSYGMIMNDEVRLYLINYMDLISDPELQRHLNTNADGSCDGKDGMCVNVREYSQALIDLGNLGPSTKVSITPTSRYAVKRNAENTDSQVDLSPIQLMKSVKNSKERERYYECQVRDSAALVEFMTILEKGIEDDEDWTELSATNRLTEIRSTYDHYKMNSFTSISAVGANAGVIHYRASEDTDTVIDKNHVYLLDSGGNYLDGTTDVTRTFHFGTPRDIEIEAYTRVLIGVIELATTVWPFGLRGAEIDARTRAYLWEYGWDFNHGTGHGIGYFLNVHEGPGRIAMGYNPDNSPLYEGMFFSDEPGYYEVDEDLSRDEQYGIRLETIVGVVDAEPPNRFNDKQYLTFRAATLVPFEPKLINYSMLNAKHRRWLNEYNKRCMEETGIYLQDRNKMEAYDWLVARTAPIPEVPDWGVSASNTLSNGSALIMGLGLIFAQFWM